MLHVIRFSKSLKQNDLPPSAVRMVDALNTSGTPWEYVDIQFATSFIYTNAQLLEDHCQTLSFPATCLHADPLYYSSIRGMVHPRRRIMPKPAGRRKNRWQSSRRI